MNSLTGAAALALVMLALIIWQCSDWIEAHTEASREQARRIKLENDKLAFELATQQQARAAIPPAGPR
ncbi:MAG: hypothetical protein ACJ8GW_08495 [Massilia sp.]